MILMVLTDAEHLDDHWKFIVTTDRALRIPLSKNSFSLFCIYQFLTAALFYVFGMEGYIQFGFS